jgi:type I restriction enzyme S subunit
MENRNWKEVKLTDLGTLQRGKSKHRPRYAFHLFGGKYPFIQTGEIREASKYVTKFEKTYSEAGLKQSKLWPKGTLCITIAANIAELAILDFDACFPDSVLGFIPNLEKTNVDFVYYLLCHFQKELKHIGEGSVQDNINLGTFNDVLFPVPPLPEQKAIASVLSSLDDKIDLLHQQNQTLETLAETLFRQWFIEEAKEDWPIYKFKDIVKHVKPGTNFQPKRVNNGIPFLNVKNLNNGFIDLQNNTFISQEEYERVHKNWKPEVGDVLISRIGTLGLVATILERDLPIAVHYNMINLKPKLIGTEFLYFFLKSNHFQEEYFSRARQSVQEYLAIEDVEEIEVKLPLEFEDFAIKEKQFIEFYNKIKNNFIQIQTLTQLRNTLLPKLMSGEVRVQL